MKLRTKAANYAEEQCGNSADVLYPTSLTHTLGQVAIEDFQKGYMTAIEDFYEAIKANPKLSAKEIFNNIRKEI